MVAHLQPGSRDCMMALLFTRHRFLFLFFFAFEVGSRTVLGTEQCHSVSMGMSHHETLACCEIMQKSELRR